ncbi:MAG: hypothetical protein LBJ23_01875 [Tannerella sp.]|jgi:uncharacterized lipoprotein|nr:hypothetical protein [Tannerella sp.]
MIKTKGLAVLLCLVLAGCTTVYDVENPDSPSEVTGKTPSIPEMLDEFRATHGYGLPTKAGGTSDLNILDIRTETCVYDIADEIAGSLLQTKSGSAEDLSAQSQVTLSTVTFESEGQTGFSILTNDSRIARVYAFTESGQLSDTT